MLEKKYGGLQPDSTTQTSPLQAEIVSRLLTRGSDVAGSNRSKENKTCCNVSTSAVYFFASKLALEASASHSEPSQEPLALALSPCGTFRKGAHAKKNKHD